MLKKMLIATLFASVMGVNAFAYDTEKAKYFDAFYSQFTPKVLACAPRNVRCFSKPLHNEKPVPVRGTDHVHRE